MTEDVWATMDSALIRMRRFIGTPPPTAEGVDLSWVLVADAIARRSAEGDRTRIVDVAESLSVRPSTASRLVASTESAGYLSRTPSAEDPRSVELTLTPAGERLNVAATEFRTGLLRQIVQRWDDEAVATFARLLDDFSRTAHSVTRPTE